MRRYLRFFRAANLVTAPGDALVGAAAALALTSLLMYMFGLADNDIVGAPTDPKTRPVAAGEISLRAAKLARGACLTLAAVAFALAGGCFPLLVALTALIIVYNRTKNPLLMGLARGANVLLGGPAWLPAAIWTVYIAAVTKYSERETIDPKNDRRVQWLVRGLLVLQAAFLIYYIV